MSERSMQITVSLKSLNHVFYTFSEHFVRNNHSVAHNYITRQSAFKDCNVKIMNTLEICSGLEGYLCVCVCVFYGIDL